MKLGVVGLGKVGLVLAQTLRHLAGHEVKGFDLDPDGVRARLADPWEDMPEGPLTLAITPDVLVAESEVIFVVVQTPHPPGYSGTEPLTREPVGFNVYHLQAAVGEIVEAAHRLGHAPIIAVTSTVHPGVMRTLPSDLPIVYCPVFISLGSTYHDLTNPPIIIVGHGNDLESAVTVGKVLQSMGSFELTVPMVHYLSFEEAELFKLAYNCSITSRINFVNSLAELSNSYNANVDVITDLLDEIPPIPIRAGLGDGGACRPRDLVAMSYATKNTADTDIFMDMIDATENHAEWCAAWIMGAIEETSLPVCFLGLAYKGNLGSEEGSPALLVLNILSKHYEGLIRVFDPHSRPLTTFPNEQPFVYFIGAKHDEFLSLKFPAGSVVIDPWGWVPIYDPEATFIRPGRDIRADS